MSDDKKFDPKQRKKLNDPLRLKWVPPAKIVHIMDLIEGGEYVDLGAGTGYMSGALGEFETLRLSTQLTSNRLW